jgi:ABC-type sugar transport system substrate-binding protein
MELQKEGEKEMTKTWHIRVISGLVCLAVLAIASGCGSSSGSPGASGSPGGSPSKIVVGFSITGMSLPIIADAYHAAAAEAKALGVGFRGIAKAEYTTAEGQNNEVRTLLAAGVSALVIDPADSQAIGEVVKLANQDNVPVIMVIGDNKGAGQATSYVGPNEVLVGHDQAVAIFKLLGGKGEVAYIQGSVSQGAGYFREQGFREALKEYPGIKLAAYGIANWSAPEAQKVARDMLTAHPGLGAILTDYDGMTQGALAAVQAAHAQVLLAGIDGEDQTLSNIWQGTVTLTGDEVWTNIAAKAVGAAVKAAQGESIPARIETPYYVITKQAMEQVLAGTFPDATPLLKAQIQKAAQQ